MTKLTIKTLDFSSDKIDSRDIAISDPLSIKSAKSVSYVIRWQLARKRQGSAKTKTMAEISGTTAKPYKQKGTGNARQGSKRSVQFVGGRTCHGPTPRSFDFTIPKKISRKALIDAISLKISQQQFFLFSNFGSDIKTSKVKTTLQKNSFSKVLIIHNSNDSLVKSARNIKNIKALDFKGINVYDILKSDQVICDNEIFDNKILGDLLS